MRLTLWPPPRRLYFWICPFVSNIKSKSNKRILMTCFVGLGKALEGSGALPCYRLIIEYNSNELPTDLIICINPVRVKGVIFANNSEMHQTSFFFSSSCPVLLFLLHCSRSLLCVSQFAAVNFPASLCHHPIKHHWSWFFFVCLPLISLYIVFSNEFRPRPRRGD